MRTSGHLSFAVGVWRFIAMARRHFSARPIILLAAHRLIFGRLKKSPHLPINEHGIQ